MRNRFVVLSVFIVFTLVGIGCSKNNESTQAPPQPKSQAAVEPDSVPASQGDSEAALVLKAYIAEPKGQNRVKYVRAAVRVGPIMQEMYARNYKPFQNENIHVFPADLKTVPVGGWVSLTAEWDDIAFGGKEVGKYIVFRSHDGFKVDWEASLGYNPTQLRAFVVKQDDNPITFRVLGKLDNYYNFEYGDTKSSHYSVWVEADGIRVHGYVPRKSTAGERIYALLQDGQEHPLVLQLQHVGPLGGSMKGSDSGGRVVAITKLVSESWVLPD